MSRMICKRGGVKPDGITKCDAFDTAKWACIYDGACELQEEQIDDEAINSIERVSVPGDLAGILERLKRRPDLFEILGRDIYAPIKEALKITDKTSHLASADKVAAYWENSSAMEFDMGRLSSISIHIDALASKMESDKNQMESSLSIAKAAKFIAIKKSYEAGIRLSSNDRITDTALTHMVKIDPQIKELNDLALKTSETSMVFRNFYNAIIQHIQVMKKRIESAKDEKRNTKYIPG